MMEKFEVLLERVRAIQGPSNDGWDEMKAVFYETGMALNRHDAATMMQSTPWSWAGGLLECLRGTGLQFSCWVEDDATVVELLSGPTHGTAEVKGRGSSDRLPLALCEALLSAIVEGGAVDITKLPTRRDLDSEIKPKLGPKPVGDGATDDTAAVQALVDAKPKAAEVGIEDLLA